jgi:hypothetical protein
MPRMTINQQLIAASIPDSALPAADLESDDEPRRFTVTI